MKHHYLSVRWQNWLFCMLGFVYRLVRLANVPMCGWLKLN
jgi:hypothetical protein